jgi:hypothetical protein
MMAARLPARDGARAATTGHIVMKGTIDGGIAAVNGRTSHREPIREKDRAVSAAPTNLRGVRACAAAVGR